MGIDLYSGFPECVIWNGCDHDFFYHWIQVQNLIEQCLAHYMTKKQVMDILYQQQNIEPTFTKLGMQFESSNLFPLFT